MLATSRSTPSSPPEAAPPAEPRAAWRSAGEGSWVLALAGDWRAADPLRLPEPPDGALSTPIAAAAASARTPAGGTASTGTAESAAPAVAAPQVQLDGRELSAWDARLPAALWQRLQPLQRAGATLDFAGLPPGLRQVLSLALPPPATTTAATPAAAAPDGPAWLRHAGERARGWWDDARQSLTFVGEVLIAAARALRGKGDLRAADLAWHVEHTGPRSMPIVALVSAMVGLILAYMGAAQLARFGAKSFIADLMTVSVVREIAALLVGVILSGRVGAAFAAQLGAMRAGDELDALRTLGVDPVSHLVLPRVLALLLVAPLLTAFGAAVGMSTGWLAAMWIYGVPAEEYLAKTRLALAGGDVAVGLIKGSVYGVLVALAGCRQGLYAGRSAQAVGDAVTQSVVKSIVWIVCSASVLTVIFQRFDV
jgi:phospholipid/cholesterol/gamma-HCH transport system permease protein